MVNTLTATGAHTATWLHIPNPLDPEDPVLADPADSYLSVTDWAGLPSNSRLKETLNKTYASIGAFMTVWAGLGGSVDRTVREIGALRMPVWFLDGEGYPKLYCIYNADEFPTVASLTGIVKLSLAYSASE